jgi:HlyD family secretion protein
MTRSNRRKSIQPSKAGGISVLLLLLLAGCKKAPLLQVADVTREDITAEISSNGKIEPINPIVARAEFVTFVDKVMATEGQTVRKGHVILTLDSAEMRSDLAQAQASLLAAKMDLQNAHAGGPPDEVAQLDGDKRQAEVTVENLERTEQALEQLVAKQAATQEELAQSKVSLAKARANLRAIELKRDALSRRAAVDVERVALRVKQAQDEVESLGEKVRSATVVSPLDGTLYSLPVRAGAYVQVGDILAEMADLRHVRVRAFVDEPDLGLLEPNQMVQVTWDAKPGQTWTGHTEQTPKQVVARGTRSVGEVLCSVENDKLELLPNINVEVRILVRQRSGAVVVPRAAVRYDKGQHYVYVYSDGKIHRRNISVGVASTAKYEVLTGLKANERVALPGDRELRDGMEIRAAEAE